MASIGNYLIKFEQGAGINVTMGTAFGKVVIGPISPPSSTLDMYGVACDASECVYVSDVGTATIYKVTEGGRIRILAGWPGSDGYVNGTGVAARFKIPKGVACDASGNVYIADAGNNRVRRIDPNGKTTTLAGGFNNPCDVACDPTGDIIVADTGNHKIYRVNPNGRKLLVAGSTMGNVSGTVAGVKVKGTAAKFHSPMGVACDNSGNIYVADTGNYQIKKISSDGWVTLFCGSGAKANILGDALTAAFIKPIYIAVDNTGELFVIDRVGNQNRIKRISPNGVASVVGYWPGSEWLSQYGVLGVASSPAGKIFVVASDNQALAESSSSTSTVAMTTSSSQTESSTSTLSETSQSSSSSRGSSLSSRGSSMSSSSSSKGSSLSTDLSLTSQSSKSSSSSVSSSSTSSVSSGLSTSSQTNSTSSQTMSISSSSSSSSTTTSTTTTQPV